jgi:hypothetical protein
MNVFPRIYHARLGRCIKSIKDAEDEWGFSIENYDDFSINYKLLATDVDTE